MCVCIHWHVLVELSLASAPPVRKREQPRQRRRDPCGLCLLITLGFLSAVGMYYSWVGVKFLLGRYKDETNGNCVLPFTASSCLNCGDTVPVCWQSSLTVNTDFSAVPQVSVSDVCARRRTDSVPPDQDRNDVQV